MKMVKLSKLKIIFLFFGFYFLFSLEANAASLNLISNSKEATVGAQFKVDLVLNGEEGINALEGKISFPANIELSSVQDGNSIINFWIERPAVKQGEVSFSGVIPGGYTGRNGLVFSLIFKAVLEGSSAIELNSAKALLNDGQGTAASLTISNFKLVVKNEIGTKSPKVKSSTETFELKDTIPPDIFSIQIARDPDLFNNQWFIVFATQDKGSGIDHYEVKETNDKQSTFGNWIPATSPYLLTDQNLYSYIYVRAIDKAGNERIALLPPTFVPWYKQLVVDIFVGIGLIVVLLLIIWLWRLYRLAKHRKK